MKKLLIAGMLLISTNVMANETKSSFFIGTDVNIYTAQSETFAVPYTMNNVTNLTLFPRIDGTSVNASLNAGYEWQINDKYFIAPQLSYDFITVNLTGDDDTDTDVPYGQTGTEYDYTGVAKIALKYGIGAAVDFGYNINTKNKIFLGIGVKALDYTLSSYNILESEDVNEYGQETNYQRTQSTETIIEEDSTVVVPVSIGYMFQLTDELSFDASYEYSYITANSKNIDLSNIKLGARLKF